MNLLEAKQFEYAIQRIKEEGSRNKELPNYKILWKVNSHLLFCNTYQTGNGDRVILSSKINFEFGKEDINLAYLSGNKKNVFQNVSNDIITPISQPYISIAELYLSKEHLFNYVMSNLNPTKELNSSYEKMEHNTIYNVEFLNFDTKIDFMKVDDDFKLTPIS